MQDWNEKKKIMTDKYIKIPYGAGGGGLICTQKITVIWKQRITFILDKKRQNKDIIRYI